MDDINLNNSNIPLSELKTVITDEVNKALKAWVNFNPSLEKPENFLSRKEAAAILKVSLTTLNNYTKAGKVRGYKLGGSVKYKIQDLENCFIQIKN